MKYPDTTAQAREQARDLVAWADAKDRSDYMESVETLPRCDHGHHQLTWLDNATGLICRVEWWNRELERSDHETPGNYCGYVEISSDHPLLDGRDTWQVHRALSEFNGPEITWAGDGEIGFSLGDETGSRADWTIRAEKVKALCAYLAAAVKGWSE